jgi:hypothetical protein
MSTLLSYSFCWVVGPTVLRYETEEIAPSTNLFSPPFLMCSFLLSFLSWAHVSDDIITVRLLTAPSLSITKIVMLYVIVFVV